jgi:hypothetical protein
MGGGPQEGATAAPGGRLLFWCPERYLTNHSAAGRPKLLGMERRIQMVGKIGGGVSQECENTLPFAQILVDAVKALGRIRHAHCEHSIIRAGDAVNGGGGMRKLCVLEARLSDKVVLARPNTFSK